MILRQSYIFMRLNVVYVGEHLKYADQAKQQLFLGFVIVIQEKTNGYGDQLHL